MIIAFVKSSNMKKPLNQAIPPMRPKLGNQYGKSNNDSQVCRIKRLEQLGSL